MLALQLWARLTPDRDDLMLIRSLLLLLTLLCWNLPAPVLAQDDGLPTISSLQDSLAALKDSKLTEAEIKVRQEIYQESIKQLQALAQTEEQQAALKQKIKQAPQQINQAQRELKQLQEADEATLHKRYDGLPQTEQERLVALKNEQLAQWKEELAQVNSELISAQTSPERSQAEIANNQAREQSLNAEIKSLQRQATDPLSLDKLNLRRLEIRALDQANQLRRQQLAANATLMDLGLARRELLSQRISQAERDVTRLMTALNERRLALSERTLNAVSQGAAQSTEHSLLREHNDQNLAISQELLRASNQIAELTRQNMEARQQLDRLGQIEHNLSEQIAVLKNSLLLSKILQQQKQALPHIALDKSLPDRVADIRLRQFELSQQREALRNPELQVTSLLAAQSPMTVDPEVRDALTRLIKARAELLERLNTELGSVLNQAISLQISQQQIQRASETLQATLDEQLFWIPSNRPLGFEWLQQLPAQLGRQIASLPWLGAPAAAFKSFAERPLVAAILAVLIAGYIYRRKTLLQRLGKINREVGQFRKDGPWHTPLALLLNAVLVAPVPLVLYVTGTWLRYSPDSSTPGLGAGLAQLGIATFMLHLLYRVLRRSGVAERHFRWDPAQVANLRRVVRHLSLIMLPLAFVIGLAEPNPGALPDDVLGVLILVVGCLALSLVLARLMLHSPPLYNSKALHFVATLLLILLPLGLVTMTALGYYYTALKLADRFQFSLFLLVAWLLAAGLAERNLWVAANRLGYQRAQARREAAGKEGASGEALADNSLNMSQINQQSMRLVKLALGALFSGLLYWVWSDLIGVFAYLDGVTLWAYSSGAGEATVQVPISLRDLMSAGLVVALTLVLARNLPGLLEMLVLSKLQLRQGSSYAMTTLLSYSIVGIGLVSTLSTLGVSWDKLQWLVAALSVGLGFGLQEIFANFVSGLIILFERPARIGDTVTIGNLSGTVSRIRIRATTITDFDHKEIIVPNKTFVTDQLINWSLSDTVTRLVLSVRVAFGTDLELVRRLLLQVAADNPRVLDDPEPMVTFLTFGESALSHELRIHVRELRDRLPATDEVNREIDRLFREHGIEIAYRKLDLHLRSSEGLEKVIQGVPDVPPGKSASGF